MPLDMELSESALENLPNEVLTILLCNLPLSALNSLKSCSKTFKERITNLIFSETDITLLAFQKELLNNYAHHPSPQQSPILDEHLKRLLHHKQSTLQDRMHILMIQALQKNQRLTVKKQWVSGLTIRLNSEDLLVIRNAFLGLPYLLPYLASDEISSYTNMMINFLDKQNEDNLWYETLQNTLILLAPHFSSQQLNSLINKESNWLNSNHMNRASIARQTLLTIASRLTSQEAKKLIKEIFKSIQTKSFRDYPTYQIKIEILLLLKAQLTPEEISLLFKKMIRLIEPKTNDLWVLKNLQTLLPRLSLEETNILYQKIRTVFLSKSLLSCPETLKLLSMIVERLPNEQILLEYNSLEKTLNNQSETSKMLVVLTTRFSESQRTSLLLKITSFLNHETFAFSKTALQTLIMLNFKSKGEEQSEFLLKQLLAWLDSNNDEKVQTAAELVEFLLPVLSTTQSKRLCDQIIGQIQEDKLCEYHLGLILPPLVPRLSQTPSKLIFPIMIAWLNAPAHRNDALIILSRIIPQLTTNEIDTAFNTMQPLLRQWDFNLLQITLKALLSIIPFLSTTQMEALFGELKILVQPELNQAIYEEVHNTLLSIASILSPQQTLGLFDQLLNWIDRSDRFGFDKAAIKMLSKCALNSAQQRRFEQKTRSRLETTEALEEAQDLASYFYLTQPNTERSGASRLNNYPFLLEIFLNWYQQLNSPSAKLIKTLTPTLSRSSDSFFREAESRPSSPMFASFRIC